MSRLDSLVRRLPEQADAALITGEFARRYLTGLASSAGTLMVTRTGCGMIIDARYFELAEKTLKGCEIILQDQLYEQIGQFLKSKNAKSMALDSAGCTLKARNIYREKLGGVTLLEDDKLSDILAGMRQCKDEGELASIRAAQGIAERTFDHLCGFVKPGITEREAALEIEIFGRSHGADSVSFSPIVAVGDSSSMPHAVPGDKKIRTGDMVLFDFGFKVGGYCSDMTRTVAVGKAGEKARDVYGTVLRAQEAALAMIKPGAHCKEVDAAARLLIDASPYAGLFGHGLGHSLGLEIHESPAFNKISEATLKPGMVMTVEPGIYLPGEFGVRIEDMVAVTEDGYINLTSSPKVLIEL
ncbi:MAG: aminopeptidase P family protein [Oscillospiraceae bacterium]|nr:aminopeptidase P family protein [Oscillospiraceae bacterium]